MTVKRNGGRCAAPLLLALLLGGCRDGIDGPPICTLEAVFGLRVEVRNGVTGEPEAEDATGTARDGEYVETLLIVPAQGTDRPLLMIGAVERPGSYDVSVTKAGFLEWTASNVTVTADECHVIPVTLQANLIPVAPLRTSAAPAPSPPLRAPGRGGGAR